MFDDNQTLSTSRINIIRSKEEVKLAALEENNTSIMEKNRVLKWPFPCQNQAGNEKESIFFDRCYC